MNFPVVGGWGWGVGGRDLDIEVPEAHRFPQEF